MRYVKVGIAMWENHGSKEIIILAIIGTIITWPLAYFAVHKWLQGFASQIDFGLDIIIWAGLTALITVLNTLSG